MRLKRIMAMFLCFAMVLSTMGTAVFAEDAAVAKVGNTEYATIDEAIANWTAGTTLTLLADVTLSDVITLKSTEHHILNLGTYTMTAASSKDAIQIENNGRSSASYALDIKADATNPGGITAKGKAIVRTAGKSGVKDRPIIRFYDGVFNASYIVYHTGSNGTNCPQFQFHGGEFNGTIYTNRTLNQFYGGTFNGSLMMSVDSSAYTLVAGGTFKQLSNLYMSSLNSDKFTIGSAKGVYDKAVYVDDNGNFVIAASEPAEGIDAAVAKTPGTNDYLAYSKVATEGKLNYTDVYVALDKNNSTSAKVTVYADEIDMTGISYKGTIVVPEGEEITIIVEEGATPAWSVTAGDGAAVTYTDTEGKVLEKDESNGSFVDPTPAGTSTNVVVEGVDVEIVPVDGVSDSYEITLAEGETWTDGARVAMTFPAVEGAADGDSAYIVHEHEGVNYIYVGKVTDGSIAIDNKVGFSTFTVYEGGLQEAIVAAQDGDTVVLSSDIELSETVSINKNITIDGDDKTITPADNFVSNGHNAAFVFEEGIETAAIKNIVFNDFSGLSRVVRANFAEITIDNCDFNNNAVSEGVITSAYADLAVNACDFNNNTAGFAVINVGSDVSDGTEKVANITGNTFDGNNAGIAVVYLASSADVTGNSFSGNIHTGENANASAVLAGPYTGNMSYTININENAFVNAMSKGEAALPSVFAEDWSSLGSTTAFDLSSNYWNGNVPAEGYATSGENPDVTLDDYYTTYVDGELGELVEIPVASAGLSGAGTAEDPYLINDIDDLVWFRDDVNAGNTYDGEYIKLTADIDLANEAWTPIGTSSNHFRGMFDGDNHTISNLYISWSTDYVSGGNNQNYAGLFGYMRDGGNDSGIKNITIENVDISGCLYVGAVLGRGYTSGIIENCHVTGSIDIEGYSYIGGIVGRYEYSTNASGVSIYNCSVKATTEEKGTINGLYTGATYIGGILGFTTEPAPVMCFEKLAVENVEVTGFSRVGGVSGIAHQGNIYKDCSVSEAFIYGTDSMVGLIVGACQGTESSPATFTGNTVDVETVTAKSGETEIKNLYGTNINGGTPVTNYVAQIGSEYYETLADAVANVEENETINIFSGIISEGTIKLPATLKNVTFKGEEGAILKDMTIMASDGNSFSYIGLTFDGITFENSRLSFTGWRNGEEIIENLTVTNCVFKDLHDDTNSACVHINKDVSEPVNGFTFTNNVIDGATGGSKSGIYTVNTGNVIIANNTFNNIVFRPALVQLADCDGIVDNVDVSNNVFSNTTRLQIYGSETDNGDGTWTPSGTDTLEIAINENIFKNISGYYICTWGINGETNIAENYYDSTDLGGKIYWNNEKPADEAGLAALGIYPVYTELKEDGTIDEDSAYTPVAPDPSGSINGGLVNIQDANRTFLTIESWITFANESIVVKVFDANDTLLATSSLVDTDRVILGKENWGGLSTFIGINCTDDWWNTVWEEDKLRADYVPAKATLFIDGIEMNTAVIQMRAAGTETEVVWADVPGVPPAPAPAAQIGDEKFASLEEAFKAATDGCTITLMSDITVSELWDCRYNGAKFTVPVTIDGNNKTLKLAGAVDDKNWNTVFRFEADATVKNLTIDASEATGIQRGISAKSSITLENCTFIGNGTSTKRGVIFGEGAGTALSDVVATITNSKFTNWSYGVSDNQSGKDAKSVSVTGSTFTNASALLSAFDSVTFTSNTVSDGYVNITSYTAADTATVVATGNNLVGTDDEITVNPENITSDDSFITPVAKIGSKYYETLDKAISKAAVGDTVVLLTDVELSDTITIPTDKKITLDLGGKTITGTDNTEKNFSLIDNRGDLTITGNGTMTLTATVNSGWNRYSAVLANNPGGKLTIENGTFEHLGGTDMAYGIDNLTNGKGTYAETIVNGGTIKSPYRGIRQFLNGIEAQNILTVNGGTVEGANKSIWMQQANANANPGTLTVDAAASLFGDVLLSADAAATEYPVTLSLAATALKDDATVVTGSAGLPEGYVVKEANGTFGVEEEKAAEAVTPFKDAPLFLAGLPDEVVDGVTYHPVYMATSIDSLNYRKVGFDYIFSTFDPETGVVTYSAPYTTETSEVYSSISDANTTYTVDSIGGNGEYLFMNKLLFNAAYYHNNNTKFTITPYAIDTNGNKITGWTFDMTNEYYKSLQSGTVKQDMFKEGN